MAMRDPKEWARTESVVDGRGLVDDGKVEALIREAQEDGARGAREDLEHTRRRLDGEVNSAIELRAQVAALTERAERAEREANEWHELLVETSSKLDDAEYERDEAVKALDIHKERADRAESELHRRKF